MKSTGMVRKIDELGRIVLPMEIRNTMGIQKGDALEIFVEDSKIILTKYKQACVFCDSDSNVLYFKGKLVCQDCLDKLRQQF